jgi:GMP synthase (glutamine-hydrolysing)
MCIRRAGLKFELKSTQPNRMSKPCARPLVRGPDSSREVGATPGSWTERNENAPAKAAAFLFSGPRIFRARKPCYGVRGRERPSRSLPENRKISRQRRVFPIDSSTLMPKLLVVQHVAYEILGTLDPLLRSYGFRIRYVNFGRHPEASPRIDGYHGLVVIGGPMNVDQSDVYPHIETEMRLIRDALDREIPILGVCLGAQLLARVLGAEVRKSAEKEIGWYDVHATDEGLRDPLLRHLGEGQKIYQWHGDTFDIPEGAVHLARSKACRNQAFRWGDRSYGLQFHLEVDSSMISRWLSVPLMRDEIAQEEGRICEHVIRSETEAHGKNLEELSDRVFTGFVELFGDLRRRGPHPHR